MFLFTVLGPIFPSASSAARVPGPKLSESTTMPSSCCNARIRAYIVGHPVFPVAGIGVHPETPEYVLFSQTCVLKTHGSLILFPFVATLLLLDLTGMSGERSVHPLVEIKKRGARTIAAEKGVEMDYPIALTKHAIDRGEPELVEIFFGWHHV